MWAQITQFIAEGHIAVTQEIFDEMIRIDGGLGKFIGDKKARLLYEVGIGNWNWQVYLAHVTRMQNAHQRCLSENNNNHKGTICLNDLSIIALAKALGLPVVSMEYDLGESDTWKRRIPNICRAEGVMHLSFNEFCRAEKLVF